MVVARLIRELSLHLVVPWQHFGIELERDINSNRSLINGKGRVRKGELPGLPFWIGNIIPSHCFIRLELDFRWNQIVKSRMMVINVVAG